MANSDGSLKCLANTADQTFKITNWATKEKPNNLPFD